MSRQHRTRRAPRRHALHSHYSQPLRVPSQGERPWGQSATVAVVVVIAILATAGLWGRLPKSLLSPSETAAVKKTASANPAPALPTDHDAPQSSAWASGSFPVENFVAYTSPFGYRQHPFGGRRFHYGLDIAAPLGSYIRAWWGGEVIDVSDDTACGTSLVIQSERWLHIYCHLQGKVVVESDGDRWFLDADGGLRIRQGDFVPGGTRIGRIGMTGRTTGPHLHWGLKYRGNWIDPAQVLRAMVVPSTSQP